MKFSFVLSTLMTLSLSATAQMLDPEQEMVLAGNYAGKYRSTLFLKDCRLEIHRTEDGQLHVAAVRDANNAYNLWAVGGIDFKVYAKTGAKLFERQLRLSMVDAGGTSIYDARTKDSDTRKYDHYGVLEVTTDTYGTPTSFVFTHSLRKGEDKPHSNLSMVRCNELRAL